MVKFLPIGVPKPHLRKTSRWNPITKIRHIIDGFLSIFTKHESKQGPSVNRSFAESLLNPIEWQDTGWGLRVYPEGLSEKETLLVVENLYNIHDKQ